MQGISRIKWLVVDVDGTMTDGSIYYDEHGNELKKFNTRDAAGFFAAKNEDIQIIVLTGRSCAATQRRMEELKVPYFYQGIKNKREFLEKFMYEHNVPQAEVGYIGDDLNDLPPMHLCGFVGCPSDACNEVKAIAQYISTVKGGYGAVRDCIEHVLRQSGAWEKSIAQVYGMTGI